MNNSTIVLLINDTARALRATYEDGHTPSLFKTLDQAIAVDDLIVVETNTRHGMTVCKVTEVDIDVDFDAAGDVKWVVHKINASAYQSILEQEKEAIAAVHSAERRRKKEQLRESLFADHQERLKALAISNVTED